MLLNNQRVYATLEIRQNQMLFTVLKKTHNRTMVVFKKEDNKTTFLNDELIVIDVHQTANKLKTFINEYEQTHDGYKIIKVALILPSEKIQLKETYEKINIETNGKPTKITKELIAKLKKVAFGKPSIEQNVVLESRSISWSIDHFQIPLNRIFQHEGKELSAWFKNYEMNNQIVKSHKAVLQKNDLEVLYTTTSINELYRLAANETSKENSTLIIDWGEDKIEAAMYNQGIMEQNIVIPWGINEVVKTIAQQLKIKIKNVEEYLFNLLNFSSDILNESLVMQVFTKVDSYKKKQQYSGLKLKEIFIKELNNSYEMIKKLCIGYNDSIEIVTYNFGCVQKIMGAEQLFKKGNAIANDYVFNQFNMGVNNNYNLNSSFGAIKAIEQINNMKNQFEEVITSIGIISKQHIKQKHENTIFKHQMNFGKNQLQQQAHFLINEGIFIDEQEILRKEG
ncbi:cell division protein FtsA [Williamsoniiplasma luminosum]|uniref:Cell division protein FtsA n=1 Tax=Williamsoniiplasma luminosum TaxID=214888 RepID=A0A2K8NTH9_9MOLU|nr:hypothetical protein [Williamsoniiplasma luminosum]ATZ17155.1 cell division protein FtsA [Williamsoniiplasma luminosum]